MLLLFSDWDETITAHDTLSLIPDPSASQAFAGLTQAYFADFNHFQSSFSTSSSSSSSSSQEHTAQIYHLPHPSETTGINQELWTKLAYLDQIDRVERASLERAQHTGIFHGWSLSAAKHRAASDDSLQLRDGWDKVVEWLQSDADRSSVQFHILSVNWSTSFIQSALRFHPASNLDLSRWTYSINANEPSVDPQSQLGTGPVQESSIGTASLSASLTPRSSTTQSSAMPGIRTGRHKLDVMRSIAEAATRSSHDDPSLQTDHDQEGVITIYVGDSTTDLPCLLHANIGILIGHKSSVLGQLTSLGITHIDTHTFLRRLQHEATTWLGRGLGSTKAHQLVLADDWTQATVIFRAVYTPQQVPSE